MVPDIKNDIHVRKPLLPHCIIVHMDSNPVKQASHIASCTLLESPDEAMATPEDV